MPNLIALGQTVWGLTGVTKIGGPAYRIWSL